MNIRCKIAASSREKTWKQGENNAGFYPLSFIYLAGVPGYRSSISSLMASALTVRTWTQPYENEDETRDQG